MKRLVTSLFDEFAVDIAAGLIVLAFILQTVTIANPGPTTYRDIRIVSLVACTFGLLACLWSVVRASGLRRILAVTVGVVAISLVVSLSRRLL